MQWTGQYAGVYPALERFHEKVVSSAVPCLDWQRATPGIPPEKEKLLLLAETAVDHDAGVAAAAAAVAVAGHFGSLYAREYTLLIQTGMQHFA